MEGMVFDIKEFAAFDGPGVRVTVFLQGCPLRCPWCHNPEGVLKDGGKPYTVNALVSRLEAYRDIFKLCDGGVTFSGGEPLMQGDFICEVMNALPGIHKALETSMYAPPSLFQRAAALADFLYVDLKLIDPKEHVRFTGVDNALILNNLDWLSKSGKLYKVRVPLIPGVTDTKKNLSGIAEHLSRLSPQPNVELLPYNEFTQAKYDQLGLAYEPPFDFHSAVRADPSPFLEYGISCIIM